MSAPTNPLRLYNTLSKQEEPFEPADPNNVTMYTCGPTVYGRPHIGNYASFLLADLLRRWLEVKGYTVTHVKNITDVGHLQHDADQGDDKVEREAKKEHVHPLDIANKYAEEFLEDEYALNFLEPAHRPRATEYIEQMKEMIDVLLQKNSAYVTSDGIYFDVSSFPQYGELSGNTIENVSAGKRIEVNEEKKHPADFALWKFCVGENAHHILRWSSPGKNNVEGFPGWHIECSAMSRALLGDTIDIHTGGEDNIFPHHECEIAQSETVTGHHPFVRMWVHRRRIDLEGAKMSKSLGNVLEIPNILERGYSPQDIRYYLLSVHYRTNLKFSWKGMDDAKKARAKIVEWMKEIDPSSPCLPAGQALGVTSHDETSCKDQHTSLAELFAEFRACMDSDLNTPGALAAIFELMSWSRKAGDLCADTHADLLKAIVLIRHTFGCFEPEEAGDIPAEVLSLLKDREAARAEKNFAESDRIRDEIGKHGYVVKDTAEGQKLSKA